MATIQIQSTKGAAVTVIYPAVKPSGFNTIVSFRLGKATAQPAYCDAQLPYLVQFQQGRRIVMFMLSDLLQTSFWQCSRNAFNILGQLDIDPETKVSIRESQRALRWLLEQSTSQGVYLADN